MERPDKFKTPWKPSGAGVGRESVSWRPQTVSCAEGCRLSLAVLRGGLATRPCEHGRPRTVPSLIVTWWEVRVEVRGEFWKTRKMLGCCKQAADQEGAAVAACELAATSASQSKGQNWNYQSTWGVPGIPEVTSLPGALRKLVLNSYWAPLKTWLNLFLFLPRSTIPYLQLLGQMCFRTEKYVNFRKVMWCIHVSYLAPEWGLAQHPITRHWERSAVRRLVFTLGTFRVTASGQILPPDEHAPAVESLPQLCGFGIAYKGLWI